MTLTALSAVFSEAPAYPNEAEMDNQMSTNSTQWVILGHAVGNTSKAKQRTVGQDLRGEGGAHGVNQAVRVAFNFSMLTQLWKVRFQLQNVETTL